MLSLFIFQPEKNNVKTVNVHLYILYIIFSPRNLNKLYIHKIGILSEVKKNRHIQTRNMVFSQPYIYIYIQIIEGWGGRRRFSSTCVGRSCHYIYSALKGRTAVKKKSSLVMMLFFLGRYCPVKTN